jgi:hypothetical protein
MLELILFSGWGNMPQKKIKHTTFFVWWLKANAMTELNGANAFGGLERHEQFVLGCGGFL